MPRSGNSDILWLIGGSLFCLAWGGYSLVIGLLAIFRGRIALDVFWRGTRRGGGDHLFSEEPGMFLFALLLILIQGGLVFWMGIGFGKAVFTPPRDGK